MKIVWEGGNWAPTAVADLVEIATKIYLVQRYNVLAVPKTVVDEKVSFEGALPEQRFLEQILKAIT